MPKHVTEWGCNLPGYQFGWLENEFENLEFAPFLYFSTIACRWRSERAMTKRPIIVLDADGVPTSVHAALIMREPNGSPNVGEDLALAHSKHEDLSGFARWWLNRMDCP